MYWWFADDTVWDEPFVRIIADGHSFEAECNLYCPFLRIIKVYTAFITNLSAKCILNSVQKTSARQTVYSFCITDVSALRVIYEN